MLFTNARNEPNLKEWVAHHLLLGFDYIHIFDHLSTVPIYNSFKNFDARVSTEYCTMQNPVKMLLMNRALTMAKYALVDWFIYMDADEFIILKKPLNGIKQFLQTYNFADSIAIQWLMFGSNNQINDPKIKEGKLLIEHYTKSESTLNNHVKSFVRPLKATHSTNPHFYHMIPGARRFGLQRQLMPIEILNDFPIPFNNSPIYIAHYYVQSEQSYNRRKNLLPADDTGLLRDKRNKEQIHSLYNNTINTTALQYVERIKLFLLNH